MDSQRNTEKKNEWGQIKTLLKERYDNISATHTQHVTNSATDSWTRLQQVTGITKNQLDNNTNQF